MYCALFVTVVISIPGIVISLPVNLDKDAIPINVRLIKEIHSPRFKRSFQSEDGVKTLPDHLVFGVPVQEDNDAILRLKRTSLVPTITSSGRVDTHTLTQNTAVYTDVSRKSALIVRQEDGDYSLEGTFHHWDREWDIKPLERNPRTSHTHQLLPLRGKNRHDEIVSSIREENPHRNMARHKRDVTLHTIEIAFAVDYADYLKWESLVGSSNAVSEMTIWYTYVAELINIRFATIEDADIAMATKITGLKIVTNSTEDDIVDDVVTDGVFYGMSGTDEARNWILRQDDLPESDHYMLFTGYDARDLTGTTSFRGSMCTLNSSLSIIENNFQASIGAIACRELGASMGADQDRYSGCDNGDQYIMTMTVNLPVADANSGNLWKFSPCAIATFKTFVSGEDCFLPENTSGGDFLPAPEDVSDRAGQVLSLDEQCQRRFQNSGSYFSELQQGELNTICGGMLCFVVGGDGSSEYVLPLEYSGCGDGLWCSLGFCVEMPTTVSTSTTTVPSTSTTTVLPSTSTTTATTTNTDLTSTASTIIQTASTTTPPTTTSADATSPVTDPLPTTTSNPNPGPTKVTQCFKNIFKKWRSFLKCLSEAIRG